MRMWMVPPHLLCRQHLLGEHNELHALVGSINKGISVKGYIRDGLAEIHNIVSRHSQLVSEMLRRGYNHKSPLPSFSEYTAGIINVNDNIQELCRRCTRCKERIESEQSKSSSL